MTVWAIRVSRSADQDMAAILAWTRDQFGTRQAQTYGRTIALALAALLEGPDVAGARLRNDLARGIHILPIARRGRRARHLIVFRVGRDHGIDVLRVLHDSMDLPHHVPE